MMTVSARDEGGPFGPGGIEWMRSASLAERRRHFGKHFVQAGAMFASIMTPLLTGGYYLATGGTAPLANLLFVFVLAWLFEAFAFGAGIRYSYKRSEAAR